MKIFFLFLISAQTCLSQPKTAILDKKSIPKDIHYKGNFIQGVRWTDGTGDNIVILTSTLRKPFKKTDPTDDSFLDAELQASHYLVLGDSVSQTWNVYEAGTCPGDFYLYFIDKTFAVTDLNKDGKAEVWIMYNASCQFGATTFSTKIIMYEGTNKYELEGESKVNVSSTGYIKQAYALNDNFKTGELVFRQYAENLWIRTKIEN